MSFVLLGILNSQAAGGGAAYWLSSLGGANNEVGRAVAVDLSDNIYTFGDIFSTVALFRPVALVKYDSSGSIQFQNILGGDETEVETGNSIAVDSVDNVYVLGQTGSEGQGGSDLLLAKYNTSGTIQWQRILGGADSDFGNALAFDSSNNVYAFGHTSSAGQGVNDLLLAKYNDSGTIQWQRILGGSGNDNGNGIAIDSSNNVYVGGSTRSEGEGGSDLLLAKYNSSGTIQWQRILGGAGNDNGTSVGIDSLGNIYVLGNTASAGEGGNDFLLVKYNSSGTVQWQRVLGGAGNDGGRSISFDSEDNIYVVGQGESAGAGLDDIFIAKYNSSGTIQWQRALGGTGTERGSSIAIDSAGNLYVFGDTQSTGAGGADFLLSKLPNDGSLTGTYDLGGNNIIYQASSLTAGTASLTAATSTLTAATSSLTAATSTLTTGTASLTENFVEIG